MAALSEMAVRRLNETAGGPPARASRNTRPFSSPLLGDIKPKNFGERGRDVRVADRGLIDELLFEVRSDRRHEFERIRSSETAVHSLAVLQGVIRDLHAAHDRLLGIRGKGFKSDGDRWRRG